MILFGAVCLLPFAYGAAYLIHSVKKKRPAAALGMLLLLGALGTLFVLLLRYRIGS